MFSLDASKSILSYANSKDVYQPVHARSLISDFVIASLVHVTKLYTCTILTW